MKNNDIRVNMDNLSENEREMLLKLINKANNPLANVGVGETFKIADIEWIRFPGKYGEVPIVAKDFVFTDTFDDDTNNFENSSLFVRLQKEILPKIKKAVGAENVLEFDLDLTADDGLDDYGVMKTQIGLPTVDFYRKNVRIFDKYNPNKWWWLATPYSTPTHGYSSNVRCVFYDGTLNYYFCGISNGVRPFLILKSCIFES